MPDLVASTAASSPERVRRGTPDPVREYVGDLAGQLAMMARASGDEALAQALDTAADLAMRPMAGGVCSPLKRHV